MDEDEELAEIETEQWSHIPGFAWTGPLSDHHDNLRWLRGVVTGVSGRGQDFDEFFTGTARSLLRAAYALTGDRGAAEDLVQEVFERLYVAWPRVDDPSAYARRALVNRGTNRWRHRSRHPETTLTDAHHGAVGDASAISDDRDALIRVLALLPARQRAVIVLRYLEDLSEVEVAQALSCSVGTVKSQASRALARLRDLLTATPETPTSASTVRSVR